MTTLLVTSPGEPPTYVPLADFLLDNEGAAPLVVVTAEVRATLAPEVAS